MGEQDMSKQISTNHEAQKLSKVAVATKGQ